MPKQPWEITDAKYKLLHRLLSEKDLTHAMPIIQELNSTMWRRGAMVVVSGKTTQRGDQYGIGLVCFMAPERVASATIKEIEKQVKIGTTIAYHTMERIYAVSVGATTVCRVKDRYHPGEDEDPSKVFKELYTLYDMGDGARLLPMG